MTLTPMKLGQVPGLTHVDMVIYGFSGAGKTYRAATAPGPIFVLSCDPTGHKSIPFPVDGVIVKTLDDVREVFTGFVEGGHGYKTLIVDGLTFLHELYVKETGQLFVDKFGAKDPDLMPIGGRMKIMNQYRALLKNFADLTQHPNKHDRVHVIFTTLEERVKEDEEAKFQVRPMYGTKAMQENFPAIFSVIGYIRPAESKDGSLVPETTRSMLFTPMNNIVARDRLGIFEPYYREAPNLATIFDKMGEKAE